MSNSLQVDKQPEVQQPEVQQPGVQQPGVQESSSQESRRPAAGDQQQGSLGPGAATDLEQPRTWSSNGHGAATDLEHPQTWISYSLGGQMSIGISITCII